MSVFTKLDSLIERAQRRDSTAVGEIVDVYAVRLYRFLYRLTGQRQDAEDLVQEVFLRVVRTIEAYKHDGKFEAWLFRIAMNLARDRIRKLARVPGILSLDAKPDSNDWIELPTPVARMPERESAVSDLDNDDMNRLQAALMTLPQPEREIIILRHYSNLTFAEIAEAFEVPLGTALARSHRGLAKLRKAMGVDQP